MIWVMPICDLIKHRIIIHIFKYSSNNSKFNAKYTKDIWLVFYFLNYELYQIVFSKLKIKKKLM